MARIVRFHHFGGPDVLKFEHMDPRPLAAEEVRIKVQAIGINRADILMRSGTYIERPALPSGLGLEAAGIVEAVGCAVAQVRVGDMVSTIPPISMARWPAYGEVAIFPARHIVRHPPDIDFVTAAASWMQYLTAYGALIDIAGIRAGEPVLITAASSSVGLAAIQIANAVGAVPIACTRSPAKRQALLEAGAHQVVECDDPMSAANLLKAGGDRGFRVVFDPVAGPAFTSITAAMAPGGILIEYGGLSSQPTPFPVGDVLTKMLTLRGYLVHEVVTDSTRLDRAKAYILDGLACGALKPLIAATFPFERIADAHAFVELNQHVGKVVVTV